VAHMAAGVDVPNLHEVASGKAAPGEHVFDVTDPGGNVVARFAWTPHWRTGDIITNVAPFILIALGSLAFFAGFALRQMRLASVRINAGEDQLRHLAMHDALSGLPNR